MAPILNRTAIFLDLAVFVGTGVFCVATQAPLMQQDLLARCQDALFLKRIPVQGLQVDGRDVILTGPASSPIVSSRAKAAIDSVLGVRNVRTVVLPPASRPAFEEPVAAKMDSTEESTPQFTASLEQARSVQRNIDRVLDGSVITFNKDVAVLTPESRHTLDSVADILSQTPNLFCEIRGYDSHPRDNRPSWVLALQRALSTEEYLESKGIADWRLSTEALQAGEGTEGRRTDRIVDLVVKAR